MSSENLLHRSALLLFCLALLPSGPACHAQAAPSAVSGATETTGPHDSPILGANFSLQESGTHNSATGWADVVTPTLIYRFNQHFAVDASVAWFPFVHAYVTKKDETVTPPLRTGTNLLGDTFTAGHFEADRSSLSYVATAVLGLPTGNVHYGLGAGSVTYNVTNHLEYNLGPFTPDVEFGEGNNSRLANPAVRKSYVATGQIANFQAGGTIDLPFNFGLDLEGYENLPLGSQTVNGTVTRKGKNGKSHTAQSLEGTGSAEDNGVNAELDLPLGRHVVLMSIYERSFVQGLDTVSAGLTWTLRGPKKD